MKRYLTISLGLVAGFALSFGIAQAVPPMTCSNSGDFYNVACDTSGNLKVINGATTTGTAAITTPAGQTYAPGNGTKTSVSGTSAAVTALTANSCIRVSCDVDVFYRTGTGTPTAVTTDNLLPAKVVERMCLTGSGTAIAFITSGGTGSCYSGVVPITP